MSTQLRWGDLRWTGWAKNAHGQRRGVEDNIHVFSMNVDSKKDISRLGTHMHGDCVGNFANRASSDRASNISISGKHGPRGG